MRDLFVEPEHFREGIGAALFLRDPNALGCYERLGMRKVCDGPSIVGAATMLAIVEIGVLS